MKFTITNNLSQNIYTVLRRCGYMPIHDRRSGKDSFSRKLSTGHYPRFHLYLSENSGSLTFDLHLDQNENRYEGQTAHNADYDSDQVKNELESVYNVVSQYQSGEAASQSPAKSPLDLADEKPASKNQSWLSRLFGK